MAEWEGQLRPKGKVPASVETADALAQRGATWWIERLIPEILSMATAEAGAHSTPTLETNAQDTIPESTIESESNWEDDVPAFLVVTHGAFLRTLLRGLLWMPGDVLRAEEGIRVGSVWNTAVAIIEVHESGRSVLTNYGDASHLTHKAIERNADEVGAGVV